MPGQAATSRSVEEEALPGDLDAGEVIMLSGAGHELLVKAVRLGQGGYILTVTPIDDDTPGAEQLITLTATTHLANGGRLIQMAPCPALERVLD